MGTFRGIELDDVQLTGDRLVLRRWNPADAPRVVEIMRDPSMREFLALPDPYTDAVAYNFVTSVGHEGRGEGTGLGCAVIERSSGRLVGSAALRLTGDPEIGYWVAPDARGHGYAAEVTRILTTWGFQAGLPRVRLACDVRNLASARTALAAGFAFEGVSRDGITSDGSTEQPAYRGDLARFARLPSDPGSPVPPAFATLPPEGLTDGTLQLRAVGPDDGPALAETDDELSRGWAFGGPDRTPQQWQRTADRAGLDWLVGTTARLVMIDVATGAVAGSIDMRLAGPPGIAGIGYMVHPAFRGRRYTTLALRLLVPWAFGPAGFARLELGAKIGNIASQRAAAAAGFEPDGVRVGRLRNPDGTFADEVRFALINPPRADLPADRIQPPNRISP